MIKKHDSKKIIYISLAVAAVIILALVFYFANKPGVLEKDKAPCFNLTGDESKFCWAIENSSLVICDEISVSQKKYECYANIAFKANNEAICGGIEARDMKYFCYNQLAILKKDSGICATLTDPYYKNQCFIFVAVKMKDSEICSQINTVYYKNQCFNQVAAIK